MAENKTINFDATGPEKTLEFLRSFLRAASDAQMNKMNEFKRLYQMYKMYRDMSKRDPNRSSLFIPKLFASIETIVPVYARALFGQRPFVPIEVLNAPTTDIGDAITDLLDAYLAEAKYDWHGTAMVKYLSLYGTSGIECLPIYETRKVREIVPRYSTDYSGNRVLVGEETVESVKSFLKLQIRAYAPWEIFKDPVAKSVESTECRGIIKFRGLVSKKQIAKMSEAGALPDVDVDKLQGDIEGLSEDNWGLQMAQEMGVPIPTNENDVGVWLSFESPDRYVDFWNFTSILRDGPNPFRHGKINYTSVVNVPDPNPFNQFYGVGDARPVEQLCYALNENWDQTFDNHNMQNQGIIFYDEEAMSVDQLVMVAGNRVPVTPQPNQKIQDAVYERSTPGLSRDHYAIPAAIERIIDLTQGQFGMQRGETTSTDQTAREAILLKTAGDARLELKVKMTESIGLCDFAEKSLSIIDQFAAPDDIISKIGVERASIIPSLNPSNMPGGYTFAFKGSDKVANDLGRRQDAKDVYQLVAGNPSIRQDWAADWLLRHFDVPQTERRKAVVPDEQSMMMQMMNAQMEAQASGKAESTRAISNGKTIGGSIGYALSGRDMSEKLGAMQ